MKYSFFTILFFVPFVLSGQGQIPLPDSVFTYYPNENGAYYLGDERIITYDDQGRLIAREDKGRNSTGQIYFHTRRTTAYNSNGDLTLNLGVQFDAMGILKDTFLIDRHIYNDQFILLERIYTSSLDNFQRIYYLDENGCYSDQEDFDLERNLVSGGYIPILKTLRHWEVDTDCKILQEEYFQFGNGFSRRKEREYDENNFLIKETTFVSGNNDPGFTFSNEETFINDDLGRVLEAVCLFKDHADSYRRIYTYDGSRSEHLSYRLDRVNPETFAWRLSQESIYFFDPQGERVLKSFTHAFKDESWKNDWNHFYDDEGFLIFAHEQTSWYIADTLDAIGEWEHIYTNRCDGAVLEKYSEQTKFWHASNPLVEYNYDERIFSLTSYGYRESADCTKEDTPTTFTIYPNPANDFIFIDSEIFNFPKTSLLIFDAKGALVHEDVLHQKYSGFYELPLLTNGMYFLHLENPNSTIKLREKLIIIN